METYLVLKWLHILSSTVLFGTGLGTAFHMWMAHRRGSVDGIAMAARHTVLADWLFTLPSGIAQPVTGFALIFAGGWPADESWLMASYALYVLALGCWLPVVAIQIRAARIASDAAAAGTDLPPRYHRLMTAWFWLGWPAFLGLIAIFWLMVAKPVLW